VHDGRAAVAHDFRAYLGAAGQVGKYLHKIGPIHRNAIDDERAVGGTP
jgi:hypothetical protein